MDDAWYAIMEARFGPAYPFEKTTEYWAVENIGYSDERRPSWFECMRGKDPARFGNGEDAYEWAQKWQERHNIRTRVVRRAVVEEYTYVFTEEDSRESCD